MNAPVGASDFKYNIYIGGNMLGRGLTIKNLIVTYMYRDSKVTNIDTLYQRARWFGYKSKIIDVCRVFTTKDIKEDYSSIRVHDEALWETIERAKKNGIPFKEMPRIFRNNRKAYLNLTRRNVARTVDLDQLSDWKQQKYLIRDKKMIDTNICILSKYQQKYARELVERKYNEKQVHLLLKNRSYFDVYDELISKFAFRMGEKLDNNFFYSLKDILLNKDIDLSVDIFWMRYKEGEIRKIFDDDSIQQLFQGRNPNNSSESYYDGDRSLASEEPDHMQIQIHMVRPRNMQGAGGVPALAVYIPQKVSDILSDWQTVQK